MEGDAKRDGSEAAAKPLRQNAPATLLPVTRCREILGPAAEGLDDAEIEQARDAALELARMLLEVLNDQGGER